MPAKECARHANCNTCKNNYLSSKAKGKSCACLYWAMQKLIENMEHVIPIENGNSGKEQLKLMLENMNDQPSESTDLKGDCVVCWETFNNMERKPVAFQCGHVVCIKCAANDTIHKCPKCQEDIKKVFPLFL